MKITKIVPNENGYSAEIQLSAQQLEFITNIGIGVLLQAGAMNFVVPDLNSEELFDKKDEVVVPHPAEDK